MSRIHKFDNQPQRQQQQQQQYQQQQGRMQYQRQNESDDDGLFDDQVGVDIEDDRQNPLPYNNYNTFNKQQQPQFDDNQHQMDDDSQIIDNPLDQTPIQVMIRVRPQFNIDIQSALKIVDNNSIYINNNETVHQFKYSRVFKPSDPQETIFKYVCEPILQHAIQGFNASFLVYGQTGTGKTHTMGLHQNNLLDEPGMIQHSLRFLFDYFNGNYQNQDDWQISISFMQIYIEEIFDLLNPSGQKLQIREDTDSNEVYVQNLITVPIKNIEQALKLIEAGLNYRMLGPQNMNQHSSRSHTILNVYIQQKISPSEYIVSNIAFVDLAGSERIKKSNSTGIRMEEAKKINSSLSALSNVISLLGNSNAQHIPYRDSKLTRILQNCLNSQSKISIIGTVEPSEDNSFETYSTLLFASRCQDIQFLPQYNLTNIFTINTDPQQEISDLKDQIKYYQNKLKTIPLPQDNDRIAKSIIEILKKPFTKLGKNLKQAQRMNEQLQAQMHNKKNFEPNPLLAPRIPFEEFTALLNENKEQEFLGLFQQTFENIFSNYGQLSLELEKDDEKKNERDEFENSQQVKSKVNTKIVTDVIEYYAGYAQSLMNQLLESEQILEFNETQIKEYIHEFTHQTNLKVKDIIHKYQVQELTSYMDNFTETNYYKICKLESYRVKQLILQLKKKIEDSVSKNSGNSKMNTNIKDFLEKQKSLNDKKFMVKQNVLSNQSQIGDILGAAADLSNPSSSMSVRSGSVNNTSLINNNSNNINNNNNNNVKGPTNLKQMMNDLTMRKKQNSMTPENSNNNNNNNNSGLGLSYDNQENISQIVEGQNNKGQKPSKTIHIQRVKILDEDINQNDKNIEDKQQYSRLTQQQSINKSQGGVGKPPVNVNVNENLKDQSISFQQQSFQSHQQQQHRVEQKPVENHASNTSSVSNLSKKTDNYNTADLLPIPTEQTLNSQLKSCNFYKKNQKYSPFIDS